MAAIDDTAAMIDYMLLQYGKDIEIAADGRADLLKWLQDAEQFIYAMGPWHWRQEEVTSFTFAVNVQTYTLDETYQDILFLFNANGDVMFKTPWPIFSRYYRNLDVSTTVGMPTRWSWIPREEPSPNSLAIAIWPVPQTDPNHTTTRIIREKKFKTLTDSATNYSFVPYNYRIVVPLKAMKLLARHEGKLDLVAQIDKDFQTVLGSMAGKEREFVEGLI